MMREIQEPIDKQEWFRALLDECLSIKTETIFNANFEYIKGKWMIGCAITDQLDNFKRCGYGDKVVKIMSEYLEMSETDVFYCLQFRRKFPGCKTIEDVLDRIGGLFPDKDKGKAITWSHITKNILPSKEAREKREMRIANCEHKNLRCTLCKKSFSKEELIKLWMKEKE